MIRLFKNISILKLALFGLCPNYHYVGIYWFSVISIIIEMKKKKLN